MKKTLYVLGALLITLAVACSPKNEEVTDEQVEVAPPSEALDSIADTDKDAVKTDENEINPTLPLPQPVMQKLTERYPGWEQPTLTEGTRALADEHSQGPFIVRGDFNNDAQQDVALQLQQGKEVVIAAILDKGNGNLEVHELQRDILFNDRGQLKSLYYLFLTEPGEELQSEATNEALKTTYDAVTVGLEGNTRTYVYTGNAFKQYSRLE